ncbi:hypothetical protein IFR05_015286, partial [Cadophora sp. M221]
MAPALTRKVLSPSNTSSSSTSKSKPQTISSDTIPNNPTKTQTTTTTTSTTTTHTHHTEGSRTRTTERTVEIVGPGSDPSKNQIWGGNEVPRMGKGMVPAIVGEEQLSQEELARMGIKPQGRWVKVSSTKTVKRSEGKRVIERSGGEKSRAKPKDRDDEV